MARKLQTVDDAGKRLSKLEEIQSLADQLTTKDLKSLSAWVSFRLSSVEEDRSEFSSFYSLVFDRLKEMGIHSPPFFAYIKNSKIGSKSFEKICLFMDDYCGTITTVQKRDLYLFFINTLIYWMDYRKIPITMSSFMSSLTYVPGVIRLSYPGATESRLLVKIAGMPKRRDSER